MLGMLRAARYCSISATPSGMSSGIAPLLNDQADLAFFMYARGLMSPMTTALTADDRPSRMAVAGLYDRYPDFVSDIRDDAIFIGVSSSGRSNMVTPSFRVFICDQVSDGARRDMISLICLATSFGSSTSSKKPCPIQCCRMFSRNVFLFTAPLKNPASSASSNDMPILALRSSVVWTLFGDTPVPNVSGNMSRRDRRFVRLSRNASKYATFDPALAR